MAWHYDIHRQDLALTLKCKFKTHPIISSYCFGKSFSWKKNILSVLTLFLYIYLYIVSIKSLLTYDLLFYSNQCVFLLRINCTINSTLTMNKYIYPHMTRQLLWLYNVIVMFKLRFFSHNFDHKREYKAEKNNVRINGLIRLSPPRSQI